MRTDFSIETGSSQRSSLAHAQAFSLAALLSDCDIEPQRAARLDRLLADDPDPLATLALSGVVTEDRVLRALAMRIGARFLPEAPPPEVPLASAEGFQHRGYRISPPHEQPIRVLAPMRAHLEMLMRHFSRGDATGIRLVTRQSLLNALISSDRRRIVSRARNTLPALFSARPEDDRPQKGRLTRWVLNGAALLVALGLVLAIYVDLAMALVVPPLLISPLFLLASLFGLAASLAALSFRPAPAMTVTPSSARFPRYSVLVPLYHEAEVVEDLVASLLALDYPRENLQFLLIAEENDTQTLSALHRHAAPRGMLVISAPEDTLKTKPRALNIALPFATGELLVVYDAEDRPEPDQLLKAATLFAALPAKTVCLQGRLAIDNTRDGFLPARFALDYMALFDCLKLGMARRGWPVPLGGSSNHFRMDALLRIGGWDAWNVTEDADLGIRMARFGYLVADLPSTTWEEAPTSLPLWINQRTRWMKGWMQTLAVHLRAPHQAMGQMGWMPSLAIASIGLSVVLGALILPFVLAALAIRLGSGIPFGMGAPISVLADWMIVGSLTLGLVMELVPAAIGTFKRRAFRHLPLVLGAPITYALVSLSAWRALFELIRRPYHWHKTPHGLAQRRKSA